MSIMVSRNLRFVEALEVIRVFFDVSVMRDHASMGHYVGSQRCTSYGLKAFEGWRKRVTMVSHLRTEYEC